MLRCPSCRSQRIWKDGIRYMKEGMVQRYVCRSCGHRFSDPKIKVNVLKQSGVLSEPVHDFGDLDLVNVGTGKVGFQDSAFTVGKDVGSHDFSIVGKTINEFLPNSRERRVRASEREAKNLVEVESRTEKRAAGATPADVKGKIVEFLWHLKKQGKTEATIKTYTAYVGLLNKAGANIFDPESTKLTIADYFRDRNTKRVATCAYDAFLKSIGKTWEKPKYEREDKQIFIPTEQELQLAVNCGYKQNVAFSTLVYETGARYNEAERLEWTDVDAERSKVTIKASKNGKARTVTVSRQLIDTLLSLPKLGETVFPPKANGTRRALFRKRMKRLARIYNNPRFLKIHFHTFRHCKALREYHKTKSILHVKKILGHRSLLTTQRYVDIYTEVYGDLQPEDYVCETASTVKEAKKLVESGFEYVCEINGEQLFRKVK